MATKYLIPKALAGPPGSPAFLLESSVVSPGVHQQFTPFSDPALQWHVVLTFFLTKAGLIHIEVTPGRKLGDVYATSPHKLILAVVGVTNLEVKKLLLSFVHQKQGDFYTPRGKLLAYLRRHNADYQKPTSESSYTRYRCTCTPRGFVPVYYLGDSRRCQRCLGTAGLSEVECSV